MDNLSNQQIVHAGWLIKSPPEKRIWKTKWRRRWFVLKPSGQIPGQYVLEYYTDSTCKKLKGQIDLDQCEQVDAGLQLEIRKQNYDNMFDLRTSKRTYYLVAGSEDEMNKWVECICSVCGLKMEAIQNELALLPAIEMNIGHHHNHHQNNNGSQSSTNNSPNHNHQHTQNTNHNLNINEELRYSPQPSPNEQQQQQQQHQSISESSSLSTLNYIPISECYTGKPLFLNNENRNHSTPPPPRPPKPSTLTQQQQQQTLQNHTNHLFPSVSKSQSSLALWPQQDQQPMPTAATTKAIGKVQLSSSSSLHQVPGSGLLLQQQQPAPPIPLPKSLTTTALLNNNNNNNNTTGNRSFYLNSSSANKQLGNNQSYNFYDTWHSRSKRPDFLHHHHHHLASSTPPPPPTQPQPTSQNSTLIPPHVNRDLKPNRHRPGNQNITQFFNNQQTKSDSNVVMMEMINNNKQPFKRININNSQPIMTSRHTLPRPLITSYTLRNQNNKNNDNYCHLVHCEQQPKTTIEDCERQYLDLDLDLESTSTTTTTSNNNNSNSPKTTNDNGMDHGGQLSSIHHHSSQQQQQQWNNNNNIPDNQSSDLLFNNNNNSCDQISTNLTMADFADNPGTVYKEVDFLKTKALNEMRLNMNIYRKAN